MTPPHTSVPTTTWSLKIVKACPNTTKPIRVPQEPHQHVSSTPTHVRAVFTKKPWVAMSVNQICFNLKKTKTKKQKFFFGTLKCNFCKPKFTSENQKQPSP